MAPGGTFWAPIRRAAGPLAALGLLAVLCAPAFAQPPPVSYNDFVAAAASAGEYELMAARLALVESKDARVRAFATVMLDHTSALAARTNATRRSNLKPPTQPVGDGQTALLRALQGLRGAEFDRAYARQQALVHRQAAATERGYLQMGSDASLRAVAEADLAMIEGHDRAAKALESRRD